jgi:hypothetical protein
VFVNPYVVFLLFAAVAGYQAEVVEAVFCGSLKDWKLFHVSMIVLME